MNNYIRCKCYNPFRCRYFFVDVEGFLADNIFIDNKLRVTFNGDYGHHDYKGFRIVDCSFPRWKEKKFLMCLDKLNNKAILSGFANYTKTSEELIKFIMNGTKNDK